MHTVKILSFRTDMPGQTVQTQKSSLIRVNTVCYSVCIVWTHYSMVEPRSSNFRMITTNVLGVRIFRKFTVSDHEDWTQTSPQEQWRSGLTAPPSSIAGLNYHLFALHTKSCHNRNQLVKLKNHWWRTPWDQISPQCHMDRVKRIWYLSPMRAAKVQASLRIRAVSPEPSLLTCTSSESRGTVRQKARSQAPLNGWACAVKFCHDGMLKDTNSLDRAHVLF